MSAAPATRRARPLEVRLFALSPFGPILTGALVTAVLFGAYAALAVLSGQALMEPTADGQLWFESSAWAALVLSLVFAASLTLPAISARQWADVSAEVARTLDAAGAREVEAMSEGPPAQRARGASLGFALGALGGVVFNLWLMQASALAWSAYLQSTGAWFALVAPVLFGLGVRSLVQLRTDDKDLARLIGDHLDVTPAQFGQLEVYGRLALRGALAWIVLAAIILLFFVNAAPVPISVGTLLAALVAAAYVFITTIMPVVSAASAIRESALEEVRARIETDAGRLLTSDAAAQAPAGDDPSRLNELIVYEAWLEKRPVWPISAPITRRLALYGFIPVVAWFGAAAAELALERLA